MPPRPRKVRGSPIGHTARSLDWRPWLAVRSRDWTAWRHWREPLIQDSISPGGHLRADNKDPNSSHEPVASMFIRSVFYIHSLGRRAQGNGRGGGVLQVRFSMHVSLEIMTFKEVKKQRRQFPSVFPWKEVNLSVQLEVSVWQCHRKDNFLLTYLILSWSDLNLLGFKQSLGKGGMEETIPYIWTGAISRAKSFKQHPMFLGQSCGLEQEEFLVSALPIKQQTRQSSKFKWKITTTVFAIGFHANHRTNFQKHFSDLWLLQLLLWPQGCDSRCEGTVMPWVAHS